METHKKVLRVYDKVGVVEAILALKVIIGLAYQSSV